MLVGAPGYRTSLGQTVGKLYGFSVGSTQALARLQRWTAQRDADDVLLEISSTTQRPTSWEQFRNERPSELSHPRHGISSGVRSARSHRSYTGRIPISLDDDDSVPNVPELEEEEVDQDEAHQESVTPPLVFSITGVQQQGKFGFAIAYGSPVSGAPPLVAVSAPSVNTTAGLAGEVVTFFLQGLKGEVTLDEVAVYSTLQSSTYSSRYGWKIAFSDLNGDNIDDLVVTAPLYTDDSLLAPHQHGLAVAYHGGSTFPRGLVADAEQPNHCDWHQTGDQKFGRLGSSLAILNTHQGSAVAKELVLGEPMSAADSPYSAEMSGSVHFYSIASTA